jgi:chromosome segregation ATPase
MRMRDPQGEVSLITDWRDDWDTRKQLLQSGLGTVESMQSIPTQIAPYSEDAEKAGNLAAGYEDPDKGPHMVRIGESLREAEREIRKRLAQVKQEIRESVKRARDKEDELKDHWEDNRRKQGRIQILEELTKDPQQLHALKSQKNRLQEEASKYEDVLRDVSSARTHWEGRV